MQVEGQTFENQPVEIDGNTYVNCTFHDCMLVFRGKEPFMFSGSRMLGTTNFRFDDAAAVTVAAIKFMANPATGLQDKIVSTFPELFRIHGEWGG